MFVMYLIEFKNKKSHKIKRIKILKHAFFSVFNYNVFNKKSLEE